MIEITWYFRLFYVNILWFVVSFILSGIIKAKRMGAPEPKSMMKIFLMFFIVGCILMWFVPFSINLAFGIGLGIIISGEVIYSLGFLAMRKHPEKKKAVVDWGIYKISRHSHVLAGIICVLGVMGWNPASVIYMVLWIYFVIYVLMSHFHVLSEEKVNIKKFGQEYKDYMNKTPRYIGISKSEKK
jgi:protein-S-isoprenylcysteine O-methyltransferase Ste14